MEDIIKERIIGKILEHGIEPSDIVVDEVLRYIKFSSTTFADLDSAIDEYIKWRWSS